MRPDKMRERLGSAVCRDRLSPESYRQLVEADSWEDLQQILVEVFEPSGEVSEE